MKRIANYLIALAVTAFTFTSCADVPSPFGDIVKPASGDVVVIEPSGTGTEADPYNVAGVLEYISGLGADTPSPKEVYIKGYAVELTDISASYGNATFTMSDNADGTANKFTVYRAAGLGNQKVTDESFIKQGDMVVVCGKVTNYKGNTPETVQGAAYVYSVNGKSGGGGATPATTLGTKDAPLTVAQALETIKALADNGTTEQDAYVTGKITKIKTADTDIAKNTDFTEAGQINVGDEVVVLGKLTKYVKDGNTTPEVAQGNYIVKLTKGSGGGDSNAKGTGTQADPFNIAAAISKCKEVGETASTEKYYIKGIVVKGGTVSGGYGNVSFDMGDSKDATDLFKAYQVAGSDGEKLADGYEVKAGDEVVIYGPVVNYKGNTPETPGKSAAQIVTINGKKTNEGSSSANDGSQGKPFNIAEAIAKCKEVGETASTEKYYIKGIVVKGGKVSGGYGNVSFDMGDTKDATDLFKAYQVAGTDGEKLADGYEVKAGDEVVIYGPVVNYKGNTPETPGKSAAQIVTINGKKTNEGGSSGGNTLLTNGDFEAWADGQPTGWKSASTASNASLSQSTDAHGGKYSVKVAGDEGSNKRLASQEITLPAGTYTFSFYAKATTADAAPVRPGNVPVAEGKVGSYAYGDYANINNNGWTQVTYEFTLNAETVVCLVVMNPKKSSYSAGKDVLIDDATLTKK